METSLCVICKEPIGGKRVTFQSYIELAKIEKNISKYMIGSECQKCGAIYCMKCRKKHLKASLLKGAICGQCGDPIGRGYVFLQPNAPVEDAVFEIVTEESEAMDKDTFSQIAKLLDGRRWETDKGHESQLHELLEVHGESFLNACLRNLTIGPQLTQMATIEKVDRIGALAEIGPPDLFADGKAEELLLHKLEHDKSSWITKMDYGSEQVDTLLPHIVNAIIAIESATHSGKYIPVLTEILLHNEHAHYRVDTARQLGRVKWNPQVVDALIQALQDHKRPSRFEPGLAPKAKPPSVSERALLSLIEIGNERGLSAVIPRLAGNDTFAKWTDISVSGLDTVEMLAEIGKRSISPLITALQNEELHGSQTARIALSLGNTDNPDAASPLIQALGHTDPQVRANTAEALGKLGVTHAFKPLFDRIADENKGVRRSAKQALGNFVKQRELNKESQTTLINALKDEEPGLRSMAAELIGELRLTHAKDALNLCLKDEDRDVRKAAKGALKKMGEKGG